jgi:voltage-gated potassium channel Kch
MLTETRERFLLAVTAEVPADHIAEIHFFSPIKQAGVESGVAVVVVDGADQEERIVVYTARYRLTLKGLDRGKWEASVFAEADAPLITVEAVVRGVQRRSGDVDDATRMDGEEVRAFVAQKAPTTGASAIATAEPILPI